MKPAEEIRQVLVLSTAHIAPEERSRMREMQSYTEFAGMFPYEIVPFSFGWYLPYVPDTLTREYELCPEWFKVPEIEAWPSLFSAMLRACELGCVEIKFDADGPRDTELGTYEED